MFGEAAALLSSASVDANCVRAGVSFPGVILIGDEEAEADTTTDGLSRT